MFWSFDGSWGRITAGRVHHPRLESQYPGRDEHFAAFVLGGGVRIERRLGGERWRAVEAATDAACFVPAGRGVEWAARAPFSAVNVFLPDNLIVHATSGRPNIALLDGTMLARPAPAARQLAEILADELKAGNPKGVLYADALALALGIHMATTDEPARAAPRSAPSGLTIWQARRAVAFMEAHLGERVTLAALSAEVGLGRDHFARCFRQTLGVPPYRYLLELRMTRARDLLARSSMPIADVAVAVGYEGGSAFSAAFRRVTGTTPGAVRRGA